MITLIIDNSYSKVTGLTIAQHKELRSILSYELPTRPGDPKRRASLLEKSGSFPTGLLSHVEKYVKDTPLTQYQILDDRIVPKHRSLFNLTLPIVPYDEQQIAVLKAFVCGRGSIVMPTGSGKSVTMALLIKYLGLRTLVVVPNTTLKEQLSSSFKQWFGSLNNITVENIDSPKLKPAKDYDLLIIDEAHHSAAKTYRDLNKKVWNNIYHRVFFTATPFRGREEEQILLESIAGKVIYKLSHQDAVDKGYIVPLQAYYVEVPITPNVKKLKGWHTVYSQLVVNNKGRNDQIKTFLNLFISRKASTICLVKEVAHGKLLETDYIPFIKGENDNNKEILAKFNDKKINVVIGTTGVVGEGVDTRPTQFVIVAGLGKSRPSLMQQFGRALRTYPGKTEGTIILFYDKSHRYLIDHFRTQCEVLEQEYGIKPVKLEL